MSVSSALQKSIEAIEALVPPKPKAPVRWDIVDAKNRVRLTAAAFRAAEETEIAARGARMAALAAYSEARTRLDLLEDAPVDPEMAAQVNAGDL
jgi:hypothetical protein